MSNNFTEMIFREMDISGNSKNSVIIKADDIQFGGKCKIVTEEESHNGIKIILRKDENEEVQEIKFVCSCGQAKSVLLNYTE